MAFYRISLMRYLFEVVASLKPEADDRVLDADGTPSSFLKMVDHIHRSHLHSKNHLASDCYPTDSTSWGDLSEGGPMKAGILVQEFIGNQDLDNDGQIYGKDFKITDDEDKPSMLKQLELQPDWEDPETEITWPDWLASLQPEGSGLPDFDLTIPSLPTGGGGTVPGLYSGTRQSICSSTIGSSCPSCTSSSYSVSNINVPKDPDKRKEWAEENGYIFDEENNKVIPTAPTLEIVGEEGGKTLVKVTSPSTDGPAIMKWQTDDDDVPWYPDPSIKSGDTISVDTNKLDKLKVGYVRNG